MQHKKVMVFSHERSGTHFLMNTLVLNFGYHSNRIDVDFPLGLNFHSHRAIAKFFERFRGQPVGNVFKSHHHVDFFGPVLESLLEEFHVFYVFRDPRDVMTSFWRFLRTLPWDEGPKTKDVGAFMRSPPSGGMMRYQKFQNPTCLDRWQEHVRSWQSAGRGLESPNFSFVRYEELSFSFDQTVQWIAERLGRRCEKPIRPDPKAGVVGPWRGDVGTHREFFNEADHDWLGGALDPEMKDFLAEHRSAA
jgi:hypothetical protein